MTLPTSRGAVDVDDDGVDDDGAAADDSHDDYDVLEFSFSSH